MDRVWLNTGVRAVPSSSSISLDVRANSSTQVCAVGRQPSSADKSAAMVAPPPPPPPPPPQRTASKFSFMHPLTSLWPGRARRRAALDSDDAVVMLDNNENQRSVASSSTNDDDDVEDEGRDNYSTGSDGQNGNWVMNILHVRSLWKDEGINNSQAVQPDSLDVNLKQQQKNNNNNKDDDDEDCDVCSLEEIQFDRYSFSRLLKRVSLADAKLYAKMSYLGNLAYSIPNIKPRNLLKKHSLRLVTSSIEKKELAVKAEKKEQMPAEGPDEAGGIPEVAVEEKNQKNTKKDPQDTGNRISAYAAYQIAASAASYLHSQTTSILPLKSKKPGVDHDKPDEDKSEDRNNVDTINSDVASLMATTDSVTAVVAAKEEVKQAVADDLNSTTSSPCEWFICDDDQGGTRFFVIQGSETLASWKANLLFEPIQFEGMDVLVHRGIYEAAKGIYEQMLPEIRTHMNSFGNRARFRFTGHSLGGSLALLVNLMLLIRGELPLSSLLPVITFGSPSIMCGGDKLLRKLGLPTTHIQSVMMHRDIVPRAFSCNYPNHVAELLKAVNGNFRNHPCLNNQKLLYAPMGELLILQPDEKFSPHHDLLPAGSGLYLLSCPVSDASNEEKLVQAARMVFLNSPHPLEILSDRSAYGSGGTIQRDHDMNSYLKCVRGVIRQELNHMRKARREHRRKVWWPLAASRDVSIGIVEGRPTVSINGGQEQFKFSGFIRKGKESVKRFSRLVASQHMHLFVIFLFPARMLLLGAYSLINFQ